MRKFLISVALVSTALTAVPAMAQMRGQAYGQRDDHRGDWNRGGPSRQAINELLRDLNQAESRIDRAQQFRRDGISRREAAGLRREAQQIRFRLNAALRGGINNREFASLRVQVNRLEARVRFERHDRDNRRF
jgi:hypothetical protein